MLIETAAKGGNLLLGIGPDPQGIVPPEAAKRLRQVGQWLRINGEAIYGTHPAPPYKSQNVCFTTKPPYTYAIVRELTEQQLRTGQVTIDGVAPDPGSQVHILGAAGPVEWQNVDHGFSVDLPETLSSDEHAWVVQFRMAS